MSDLISRSALIRTIKCRKDVHKVEYAHDKRESDFIRCCECSEIERLVNETPTVEAKPVVHGEWKRVGSGSLYDTYECTNCHRPPKWDCLGDNHWRIAFTDICPHCGAYMRKKVE